VKPRKSKGLKMVSTLSMLDYEPRKEAVYHALGIAPTEF